MVSSTNNKNYHGKQRVKPTNMIIASSPANQTHRHHIRRSDDNNNDDDHKSHSQASTPSQSPSINPIRTIGI